MKKKTEPPNKPVVVSRGWPNVPQGELGQAIQAVVGAARRETGGDPRAMAHVLGVRRYSTVMGWARNGT